MTGVDVTKICKKCKVPLEGFLYRFIAAKIFGLRPSGKRYKFLKREEIRIENIKTGERESYERYYGNLSYGMEDVYEDVPVTHVYYDIVEDKAMLETPQVISKINPAENGGIDLNQINVLRHGKTVNVQFDPAQLNELMQGGFQGFTPVIINITHISSPFQLLGIAAPKQEILAKA